MTLRNAAILCALLCAPCFAQDGEEGGLSASGHVDRLAGHEGTHPVRERASRDAGVDVRRTGRAAEAYEESIQGAYAKLKAQQLRDGAGALQARDYAKAIEAYRAALEISPGDPRVRLGLGEAYLSEARRLLRAAKNTQDPERVAALRTKARELGISAGGHFESAPVEAIRRAQELEASGQRVASMHLYRAMLAASEGQNDAAREGLADLYGELSRSGANRQRYRAQQREHLLHVRRSLDPATAERARLKLRAMAAEVPIRSQVALGDALVKDERIPAELRQVNRGREFCGIASFAMIAEAEGVVPKWTTWDTVKTAFGTSRAPGAWGPDGTDKELLSEVSKREYGLPAAALHQGETRDLMAEIDAGRPVMVGGGGGGASMVPTARFDGRRWNSLSGDAARAEQIAYPSHWFVVVGYKQPSEQTNRERLRSGGATLWQIQDPMRAARLEVADADFQAYTRSDKYLVRFRPQPR